MTFIYLLLALFNVLPFSWIALLVFFWIDASNGSK